MVDFLKDFFSDHAITCPCGAVLQTSDDDLVKAFIEAHKEHRVPKR